jgi:hypothetical protein
MPYPNQHAARMRNPGDFQADSFRSKEMAPGVTMVMGKLKGEDTMTGQAMRFDKDKFTAAEAKTWMKEHKQKYMSFEAATGEEKAKEARQRRARRTIASAEPPAVAAAAAQEATYQGEMELSDQEQPIRDAFNKQFQHRPDGSYNSGCWLRGVFMSAGAVAAEMGGEIYIIPFAEAEDGEIQFEADHMKWTKVKLEQQYIPIAEGLRIVAAKKAEGETEDAAGREWEVVILGPETAADIIVEGNRTYIKSKNGRLYDVAALEASVALWDGVKVYDNHLTDQEFETKQGMRSVAKEWLGVIVQPMWNKAAKQLEGVLKVVDDGLRKKFVNADKAGVLDKIGLSIDALGEGVSKAIKALGGATYQVVETITKALSVDVVADPAAGGRLARLIASQTPFTKERDMDPKEMQALVTGAVETAMKPVSDRLQALEAAAAADEPKVEESAKTLAEQEKVDLAEIEGTGKDGLITEADVKAAVAARKPPEPVPAPIDPQKAIDEAVAKIRQEAEAREAQRMKVAECATLLSIKLAESGLTKEQRELIQEQFIGKVFEAKDLEAAIEKHRKVLVAVSESGRIVLPVGARISMSALTMADNLGLALLEMVAGHTRFHEIVGQAKNKDGEPHYLASRFSESVKRYIAAGTPPLDAPVRLSQWYADIMGGWDAAIDGEIREKRMTEANITTSTVASIVKDAINVLLAADYSVRERWWEPLVRQEDVDTLDNATLVRVLGMNSLTSMSEGDTYSEMDWEDEEEVSVFQKRGGYIGVTLETFLKDKLSVIRSIPARMANAWYNEISDLVSGVFTLNSNAGPVLSDSGALFNATALTSAGGHANLLTAALSYANFIAARTAMRKQTDNTLGTGRRLNIAPKFLLVPADLEAQADEIRMSELVPGESGGATTGGEMQTKNTLQGKFEVVVVPTWTDTADWALAGDPAVWPAIYLIWLRGRRTPELFSAEDERAGAFFTNDTLRYKVRMFGHRFDATYDCAPVADFRPLHKSNV